MYTPYSPDLTPSEYYLFLSMANDFVDEKLLVKIDCPRVFPIGMIMKVAL